ncbi:hypothetical protein [Ferruginibacter sp.]|uniref:hypothetical protein n=1 Tax=Ferruginibacter sp. TaxID=1940288 RepID=UPI0019B1BE41|nr:hypothetical protein [Ferruginibacter sp.]MBC7628531.1 hypothetical protein [Ferruginibacter sp.]
MAQLSTEGEFNFYNELLNTTMEEISEIRHKHPYNDGEIIISPNKHFRLMQYLKLFEAEIDDNLGLYDSNKMKNERVERYLNKAHEYAQKFNAELQQYLINEPKDYWPLPNANLNLSFVNTVIAKLLSLKKAIKFKKSERPEVESLAFITANKQRVFSDYEKTLQANVNQWILGKDKYTCAVFCIFLSDSDFFKDNKLDNLKSFAESRYGHNFDAAIKKMRENRSKSELSKRVTKLKRIVFKTPYGKV